jgi:HrpA-like RNA helicase
MVTTQSNKTIKKTSKKTIQSSKKTIQSSKKTIQSSKKTIQSSKNIGIYDIKGENVNPLTGKEYQNLYSNTKVEINKEEVPRTYANLAQIWSNFKVYNFRNEIIKSIKTNNLTLVKAGTGVGKTVLLPKFALHAVDYSEKVITTIPKRIITKEAAMFAAETLDVRIGEEVGYYYQGESRQSNKTKLLYSTTGSLISKLTGSDPLLNEYKVVIIDEAHERSIDTDILLMLLKNVLHKRDDFRLVIMSATIDLKFFANYYSRIEGLKYNSIDVGTATLYPIDDIYINKPVDNWQKAVINLLRVILLTTQKGDILVFARSMADGINICANLAKELEKHNSSANKSIKGHTKRVNKLEITDTTKTVVDTLNPFCTQLASGIDKDKQDLAISETEYLRVFNGKYYRKIVVATNVAESSLTVNGIKYVIDTGLEYSDAYYPEYKSGSLLENKASKANIKQRRGRTGRTGPGICYHLYTKKEYDELPEYPVPDIAKTDLTDKILNLMRLPNINTIGDVSRLLTELITPPEPRFINDALNNLYQLGCITAITPVGKLTGLGQEISKFRSISANMARMIIASYKYKCSYEIIKMSSMLLVANGQLENIFLNYQPNKRLTTAENKNEHKRYLSIKDSFKNNISDLLALLNIYNKWDKAGQNRQWCVKNYISHTMMKRTRKYIKQLSNIHINLTNINKKTIKKENGTGDVIPDFKEFNNNDLVFENYLNKGINSLNDRIMMCIYIGYLPLICFKHKGNYYISCNSAENKNIQLNNKSFVNKSAITKSKYIIPEQIFWTNTQAPLKINMLNTVIRSLENNVNKMVSILNINCSTQKRELKKSKFIPNYKRL